MLGMLYYQRSSFSGFKLDMDSDWQATAPNMHHSLLWYAIVYIFQVQLKNNRVPTTLVHTKWLLYYQRYFVLCYKQQSSYNLQATAPYRHSCLVILCTSTNDYKTQDTYSCIILQTTTFLPRLHLLEVQSMVRLTSCHAATVAVSFHYM